MGKFDRGQRSTPPPPPTLNLSNWLGPQQLTAPNASRTPSPVSIIHHTTCALQIAALDGREPGLNMFGPVAFQTLC